MVNREMDLVIYVNEEYEEERALYDLREDRVILSGDYYHDKIDYKIDGYLEALSDFGIYENRVENIWIDSSHEMFAKCSFYSE